MILSSLKKLPSNVADLGKIIVATGFEWLSKMQKIAQSGHTGSQPLTSFESLITIEVTKEAKLFTIFALFRHFFEGQLIRMII